MRLLIWSIFPGIPSGFGKQCGYLARACQAAGHEVAVLAYHGLQGQPTTWNEIPVYPGGRDSWANDIIVDVYRHWRADACVSLMDTWCVQTEVLSGQRLNLACLTPVDCAPLGQGDEGVLRRSHALPLAISRHGYRMLEEAYFKPRYMPHAIDTAVFRPPADRAALRAQMGLEGRFVIGINAANCDGTRKGFDEQFQAFARFRAKHGDALLLVHTLAENTPWGGKDLRQLATRRGIIDHLKFADEFEVLIGLYGDEALAKWYGALDVLSSCSRGEGFGLPIVEAQACGTPVIVTNASSMPELCGAGWKVPGQLVDHELHHADWVIPDVSSIVGAYERARTAGPRKRAQARAFALGYEVKTVAEKYWLPVLDELASRTG